MRKASRKEYRKKKSSFPIVRYLVYLIVLTSVVFTASLSKYATTTSYTDEDVRAAKFDVDIESCFVWVSDPQGYYLDAIMLGDSKDYCYEIENKGEVAVRIRVVNTDTGDPLLSEYIPYDADDNVVALDSDGWFYLSAAGSIDAYRQIKATVTANDLGTIISFYFEIEQSD